MFSFIRPVFKVVKEGRIFNHVNLQRLNLDKLISL